MDTVDYSDQTARVLDGEAIRIGDLFWSRPEPPLLVERAQLVASHIPPGTIAAGVSAGWVWTGMGVPTPFSVIALSSPAPSPLVRHQWKIRGQAVPPGDTTVVGGLTVLTRNATEKDLWRCVGSDEVAASQLFWLGEAATPDSVNADSVRSRLVQRWRAAYPWATR